MDLSMAENRVVEGRMVTPKTLAELIEGDTVLEVESIQDAEIDCPDCGENVLEVGYMPSITEFVTGRKCQSCAWQSREI